MTLEEFITARLLEQEQHATKDLHVLDAASAGGDWSAWYGEGLPWSRMTVRGVEIARFTALATASGEQAHDQHSADAFLVARMVRTARRRAEHALRDVESTRALVELLPEIEQMADVIQGDHGPSSSLVGAGLADRLLRLLAARWSDHPSYDPEWSPT